MTCTSAGLAGSGRSLLSWSSGAGCRVSILGGVVFPPIDDTVLGEEEREMSTIADISEPASELERLIADLSESGLLVFVFGVGWWTAHLAGATTPVFRGPAGASGCARRSWMPGEHCANATATAMSRESIRAPSWPWLPEPSRSPAHMGEEQQREQQHRCTRPDRRRSPRTRRPRAPTTQVAAVTDHELTTLLKPLVWSCGRSSLGGSTARAVVDRQE
jgi:hypothetical protein